MTKKEYFTSFKDSYGKIGWGTDALIDYIGIGNVELVNKGNKIVLEKCRYAPNL
jgi:hypothetical protein